MRAWRDLGFVQDSDDDGEDLSDESQARVDEEVPYQTTPSIEPVLLKESQPTNDKRGIRANLRPSDVAAETSNTSIERAGKTSVAREHRQDSERDGRFQDGDLDELQMDEYPPQISRYSGTSTSHRKDDGYPHPPAGKESSTADAIRTCLEKSIYGQSNTLEAGKRETRAQESQRESEVASFLGEARTDGASSAQSSPEKPQLHASDNLGEVQAVVPSRSSQIYISPHHPDWDRDYAVMSRNLRERKAIQLNPYTLEQQKHRQTMSALGARPIRVQMPSQRQQDDNNDDDDSLPDLDTILRNSKTVGSSLQKSNKRRKIQHPYSLKVTHTVTTTATAPLQSKIQSPSAPQQRSGPGFRYPPRLLAQLPASPGTASSAKIHFEHESLSVVDSDTDVQPATPLPLAMRHAVEISDESSNNSSSDSSSDTSQEIKGIQKKIKGVLPASWLKLDLKSRGTTKKSKKSPLKLPTIRQVTIESHLGVAQKRIRATARESSPPSPVPVVDSSDSESSSNSGTFSFGTSRYPNSVSKPLTQRSSLPLTRVDDDPGVQMEDNFIDHMGPSTSRRPPQSRPGPKRQKKLKDGLLRSAKRSKTSHAPSRYGTAAKRMPKPPQLSIVDVVTGDGQSSLAVPQFLQIASRQARRQPNHGRQSPTTKHIRLQTRQDTEEASLVLRNWRSGKLRPSSHPQKLMTSEQRPPLAERSTNNRYFRDSGLDQPPLKRSIAIQPHVRFRQSRLQPIALQTSTHRTTPVVQDERSKTHAPMRPQAYKKPLRAAQLEVDEVDLDTRHDRLRFQRGLRYVDREFEAHRENAHSNHQLEAFINGRRPPANITRPVPHSLSKGQSSGQSRDNHTQGQDHPLSIRRKPRKRLGRRVDVETSEYRQPVGLPLLSARRSASVELSIAEQPTLQDLGPFGTQFTIDFDVFPLPTGTYFHNNTLIGSGEFYRAISMNHRDLDVPTARQTAVIAGRSCTWSRWDDEMATAVHDMFNTVTVTLEEDQFSTEENLAAAAASLVSLLRQIIILNSNSLSFFDPVDRVTCMEKFLDILESLSAVTSEKLDGFNSQSSSTHVARLFLRAMSLQLALTQQLFAIGQQCPACKAEQSRAQGMIRDMCSAILRYFTRHGFQEIRDFLDQNQRHLVREAGIRDDRPAVEALLAVWHVCQQSTTFSFWTLFNAEVGSDVAETTKLGALEEKWYNVFTILPLLELDSGGVLQIGHRLRKPHDNWDAVKALTARVFSLYSATANTPATNINKYVRCLLVRCHHLIRGWGWRHCEPIIGLVFDFFARNKLAPLKNEENPRSPLFLEMLNQHTSLNPSPDDTSFHTFLKIIGLGLQGMRDIYDNKKIRGIAWRCIPNHGRTYRNDEEMQSADLVALRNNHDLLCTLYWASPPGFRPRVDIIHNLVEHSASHRAACRLNIKAWANLAKFQLSTDEAVQALDPFITWFKDVVEQSVTLFKLAPSEAQEEYERARKAGNTSLSKTDLERTISRNQNNVLASLVDAAAGMKGAISSAKAVSSAAYLLQESGIDRVFALFGLFSSKKIRTNSCITEVLHVYAAFMDLQSRRKNKEQSQNGSEESQDYGAWPDLEPDMDENAKATSGTSTNFMFEPLAHFLSTCFGAEPAPDDKLLTTVVDTWTKLAFSTVQAKEKNWESFLDNFSPHSWNQLRDTEQTRKFGPYFLAKIVEHDRDAFPGNRSHCLSAWLTSLVERDSQLKFQHQLTTSLLRAGFVEPLLQNLPFLAASRGQSLDISAAELRERRLALISSILANMRNHFHDMVRNEPCAIQEVRADYASFLKLAMTAMKKNFLELQHADNDVRGSYVSFVHKTVEFLQQYTSDICAVDTFFTDSSIFPLPANDPKYVVGRLKGYGTKFADTKAMKQLASFLLNVSARAAVDGEQSYLADQLQTAMSRNFETGNATRLSLRSILLEGIFPSYIQASLSTPSGWIMALPILKACTQMFRDFVYEFCATSMASVGVALQLLFSMLSTLQETVTPLSIHPELLQHPHVLHTLAAIFQVVTSILPSVDYILRRSGHHTPAVEIVSYFKSFTLFAAQTVLGHADAQPPVDPVDVAEPTTFKEIRNFCCSQFKDELKKWRREGGQYSVCMHTNSWEVINVVMGTVDEEKNGVIVAIEEFHTVLSVTKCLHGIKA